MSWGEDAPDNNSSALTVNIDEVRFGTTLGDIYAVPEPSVSPLGVAAVFICFSRRQRKA